MNHQFSPTTHPYFQNQPFNASNTKYTLTVQQQPEKARLCSFKDKVDRRPLDPPPIVQLHQSNSMNFNDYQNSANFFLHTTLANASDDSDIHDVNGIRTTAGSVVQSLHKLKDTNNTEGAFFIFADISIRIEGVFKLKFTLFQIKGIEVERICSIFSDPFRVYSPKSFPGMSESTDLTRSFSDQGVRIRIRKEARASTTPSMKRRRFPSIESSSPPLRESPSSSTSSTSHVMSMQNLLLKDEETLPPVGKIVLPLPTNHSASSSSSTTPHAIEPSIGQYYYTSSDSPVYNLPAIRPPSSSPPVPHYTHYQHPYQLNQENSSQN
ncbi:velvet factor-domain-containing protein [Parasitella parasitica]|nr:velvet factor-domain-containing protein [Parasitella parasitica]